MPKPRIIKPKLLNTQRHFPIVRTVTDITPAYGRVYDSVESMRRDWEAGKDFRFNYGPYCSIRDIEHLKEICYPVVRQYRAVGVLQFEFDA